MTILAIETATELVGTAVGDVTGVRAELSFTGGRRHTETLAPAIEHMLALSAVELSDLEAIAVDLGPGLFTGLRVGVTTAKGLAQGLGIGLIGVTSLEVLARAAADAGHHGPVVSVVDARRGEVFAAAYRAGTADPAGRIHPSLTARVCTPAVLVTLLEEVLRTEGSGPVPPGSGCGLLAVGDGAVRYAEALAGLPGIRVAGPPLIAPHPAAVLALAASRLAAGTDVVDPGVVGPWYLREADAKVNWVQRPAVGSTSSSAVGSVRGTAT